MNKALRGILLFVMITFSGTSGASEITVQDYCFSTAKMASIIMEARQAGVPLTEVLRICETLICKSLTAAAYKISRFNTPEYQKRAVVEFENQVMLECLKDWEKWIQLEGERSSPSKVPSKGSKNEI